MGKIAADYKEIVLIHIRPEHPGNPPQPPAVDRAYYNRYNGRNLPQSLLQEGQLHLYAVLPYMRIVEIPENGIRPDELEARLRIHSQPS